VTNHRGLSAHLNVAPGSFLGRTVGGLPGPVWSMIAWYLLIAGLMLTRIVYSAFAPDASEPPGLATFRFAYCAVGVVALIWMGARTPGWLLFLLVDLHIVVTSVAAGTQESLLTAALPIATLIVAALYAATWFGQREMLAHLSLLTLISGTVGLRGGDGTQLRALWIAIVVLCWGLGLFVNGLIRDLNRQVMSDSLTELLNRTGLDLVVGPISGDRPQLLPRSVAFLDLEHFKAFNDRDGHHAGDAVLRQVGHVLRSRLRANDIPARNGGDEFIVVLPFTAVAEAQVVLERVIDSLPIKCSFGVADWPAGGTFEDAVRAADREMYSHKRRDVPSGSTEPTTT